jgi:hypothetical protein
MLTVLCHGDWTHWTGETPQKVNLWFHPQASMVERLAETMQKQVPARERRPVLGLSEDLVEPQIFVRNLVVFPWGNHWCWSPILRNIKLWCPKTQRMKGKRAHGDHQWTCFFWLDADKHWLFPAVPSDFSFLGDSGNSYVVQPLEGKQTTATNNRISQQRGLRKGGLQYRVQFGNRSKAMKPGGMNIHEGNRRTGPTETARFFHLSWGFNP